MALLAMRFKPIAIIYIFRESYHAAQLFSFMGSYHLVHQK